MLPRRVVIAALLLALLSRPSRAEEEKDLGARLLADAVWTEGELPGDWKEISRTERERVLAYNKPGRSVDVFAVPALDVKAFFATGKLAEIKIIYLEVGLIFGTAMDVAVLPPKEREEKKRKFRELFDAEKKTLSNNLTLLFGDPETVKIGDNPRVATKAEQWTRGDLLLQLKSEEEGLLELRLLRKDAAGTPPQKPLTKDELIENVEERENGDVILKNVPTADQGNRGYCLVATLAMVLRYLGVRASMEELSAAAKYREGTYTLSVARTMIQNVAHEHDLRCSELPNIDESRIKRNIRKGVPIIIGRYFSAARNALHTRFLEELERNPDLLLPDPNEDRKTWPSRLRSNGKHASVIVGFNEKRGEVIFSESWGDHARERRMRFEEAEATVDRAWLLSPKR